MRKRLTAYQAKYLGLTPKPCEKGRHTARYTIDKIQWESLKELEQVTVPNNYEHNFVLSAWTSKGELMDIDTYCRYYDLPRDTIRSYKLVSHTGTPFYNIVFKEENVDDFDVEAIKEVLNREISKSYKRKQQDFTCDKEGVMKWADLHFGAHIRNLLLSPNYDSDTLLNGLLKSIDDLNSLGFKKAHIHINGDLIESFSGLNHINSWMSMDNNLIGANSVKLCVELLDKAFKEVKNLGSIKIVAGNHDRLSKNNDEDVKGGAADLISWGLTLKGYDVEFHPYIITHLVDGINHINLHGHCGISKKTTTDIIWNYGLKGVYNYVNEAHLHSRIKKASVNKTINLISDDSIDYRRETLASFFTGNYYSETLGFTTNSGYKILWDNGNGKPYELSNTI
jgi:hypothetical protein